MLEEPTQKMEPIFKRGQMVVLQKQSFNLVPTDFDALPNGRYAIKTKLDTTKTIDIRLASHHDFANAQIWTDYNSLNQSVDLRRKGDGSYALFFAHSKKR